MTIIRRANRQPMPAAASGATGIVASGIGQAASAAIISSNPELLPFQPFITMGFTGVCTAIGNLARSAKQPNNPAWKKFLGTCFAWIG